MGFGVSSPPPGFSKPCWRKSAGSFVLAPAHALDSSSTPQLLQQSSGVCQRLLFDIANRLLIAFAERADFLDSWAVNLGSANLPPKHLPVVRCESGANQSPIEVNQPGF